VKRQTLGFTAHLRGEVGVVHGGVHNVLRSGLDACLNGGLRLLLFVLPRFVAVLAVGEVATPD
jgi:hypothetical protein